MSNVAELSLTVEQGRHRVLCSLRNLTGRPLRLRRLHPKADLTIRSATGASGRYATTSSFGYAIDRMILEPGAVSLMEVDVLRDFRFREPGIYIISAHYDSHLRTSRHVSYDDLDHVVADAMPARIEIELEVFTPPTPIPCDPEKFRRYVAAHPELRGRIKLPRNNPGADC